MGRADRNAAYRAELETRNENRAETEPEYCKFQRGDWEAGLSLPESQRGQFYVAILDSFFTGVDPTARIPKDAAAIYGAVKSRVGRARATAIGMRKSKAEKVGHDPIFSPENDSNLNRFSSKNKLDSEQDARSKPASIYGTEKAALEGGTGEEPRKVPKEVAPCEPSRVPINHPITYEPTTYGKPGPERPELADHDREGNKPDTQPNPSGQVETSRADQEEISAPTLEQVMSWWKESGIEWATTDEGRTRAAAFIADLDRSVIPAISNKARPWEQRGSVQPTGALRNLAIRYVERFSEKG